MESEKARGWARGWCALPLPRGIDLVAASVVAVVASQCCRLWWWWSKRCCNWFLRWWLVWLADESLDWFRHWWASAWCECSSGFWSRCLFFRAIAPRSATTWRRISNISIFSFSLKAIWLSRKGESWEIHTCFLAICEVWWWGRLHLWRSFRAWHQAEGSLSTEADNSCRIGVILSDKKNQTLNQNPPFGSRENKRKEEEKKREILSIRTSGFGKRSPKSVAIKTDVVDEAVVFLFAPGTSVGVGFVAARLSTHDCRTGCFENWSGVELSEAARDLNAGGRVGGWRRKVGSGKGVSGAHVLVGWGLTELVGTTSGFENGRVW